MKRLRFSNRWWWLAFAPIVILIAVWGIWVFPLWTAAHAGWLPADTPGTCAAVAWLRATGSQLRNSTPSEPSVIAERTVAIATATMRSDMVIRFTYSDPLAIHARVGGARHDSWLIVARQDVPLEQLAPVVVMVLDAVSGDPLAVSMGIDDPAAGCAFNLRRTIRTMVLSPIFILLAGYTSVIMTFGIGLWLRRRLGRARKVELT